MWPKNYHQCDLSILFYSFSPHLFSSRAMDPSGASSPLDLGIELVEKKVTRDQNYPAIQEFVSASDMPCSDSYAKKQEEKTDADHKKSLVTSWWAYQDRFKLKDERTIALPDYILQLLSGAHYFL